VGQIFYPDATVGVVVEIPQVARLVRAFALQVVEDILVQKIHVAVAVSITE
jgi:hypothetical protein